MTHAQLAAPEDHPRTFGREMKKKPPKLDWQLFKWNIVSAPINRRDHSPQFGDFIASRSCHLRTFHAPF